jgi:hypothetical protein
MPEPSEQEQVAIRADAELRLAELIAVREVLWPDRDDVAALSELTTVESGIKAARAALEAQEEVV